MVSGSGEVAFIGGDAETIDLGIGMLDGAGADARKSFPEADCVVVASYQKLSMRGSWNETTGLAEESLGEPWLN